MSAGKTQLSLVHMQHTAFGRDAAMHEQKHARSIYNPCTALSQLPDNARTPLDGASTIRTFPRCTGCSIRSTHRPVMHASGVVVQLALDRICPGAHAAQHRPGKSRHMRARPVQVAKVVRRQGGPARDGMLSRRQNGVCAQSWIQLELVTAAALRQQSRHTNQTAKWDKGRVILNNSRCLVRWSISVHS